MQILIGVCVMLIGGPVYAHHCGCHARTRCKSVVRTCTVQTAAVVAPCPAPAPVDPVVVPPSDGTVVQEKTTVRERSRSRGHVEYQQRGETVIEPAPAK